MGNVTFYTEFSLSSLAILRKMGNTTHEDGERCLQVQWILMDF